jgi:transcriptional regulator of met regulon
MLKQELFEKISMNIDLFKTLTDEQKIEYIDNLKTASHSVLNTFQTT